MRVINKVGMERAGYHAEEIAEVRKAFRLLFLRGLRLEEATSQAREEFQGSKNVCLMLDAITSSKQGLARPESATYEINMGD